MNMKSSTKTSAVLALLLIVSLSDLTVSTLPDPGPSVPPRGGKGYHHHHHPKAKDAGGNLGGGDDIPGMGGDIPGLGGDVPGMGKDFGAGIIGGGYGAGYGGPSGGYSRGGIIRSTMVCKEKGPCFGKKLTCPSECFSSFHHAGKGYGEGGGGGGCNIDCKERCAAYC